MKMKNRKGYSINSASEKQKVLKRNDLVSVTPGTKQTRKMKEKINLQ